MTSPFADFIALRLSATSSTPPELVGYDGRILYLPPEYLTGLGSGQSNPGRLVFGDLTIPGWLEASGSTGHQFFMEPPFTAALRNAVLAIPGTHSWTSTPARTVYRNAAVTLLELGMAGPDVATLLTNVYNAAKTNEATSAPGG